jgi:hypothetical protein
MGNNRSTSFRSDPWVDGHCITDLAPDLYGVVAPRMRKCSVMVSIMYEGQVF